MQQDHSQSALRNDQIVHLAIDQLVSDPRNARQHSAKQVQQLAKSITTFGFTVPILIDGDRNVIAGHGRLLAAQQLGWHEVPTITLAHLTPEQVKAYRIADNRLTDCSTWDDRLLAAQLKELSEADLDFSLDAIGFDLPEIDLRIQSLGDLSEEPTDDADAPESLGPPVSVVGDVWQLGPHRIECGNALEAATYEALLGSDRAAMVFSDPPYNTRISNCVTGNGSIQHREFAMASGEMSPAQFTAFLSQAIGQMIGASVPGALLYLCMDWRHIDELSLAAKAHVLELKNVCVWDKGVGGMGSFYRSQYELVFVYKSGREAHKNNVQLGRFGRNRTNVWQYPGINSFARKTDEGNLLALHPTVKPVALVADALLDASERGDIVLDPFLGSGTTIIAAEKTGRIGRGIELDPHYVDTAVRRWQRLTGQAAVHAATGESFDVMAQARTAEANNAPTETATDAEVRA